MTAPPAPTPPKVNEVVIGLIEPLTGKYAVFGQEARQAAELIVDIIN
jgi:ABC-type branched-subunit amino acid transport system substrate-binding protein